MNASHPSRWISARSRSFDSSGIRKVFDLAAKLKDPINLSIGQPDFEVPVEVKQACITAIQEGKNAYSLTQGIKPLRERLKAMTETTDGFEIAERDLRLRGPGDFFGTRQAGVPTFRLIDLARDHDMLDLAKREADDWLACSRPSPDVMAQIVDQWSVRFRLIEVG